MKRMTIALGLGITMLLTIGVAQAQVVCFTGGPGATDSCYEDFTDLFTWDDALVAATTQSHNGVAGRLVTINSADESAFLAANLPPEAFFDPAAGFGHWIGGECVGGNCLINGFTWITGEPVTHLNWCPGERNGDSNGNLHYFSSPCWNDAGGTAFQFGYVVEYPGAAVAGVPATNRWSIALLAALLLTLLVAGLVYLRPLTERRTV